MDYTGKLYGKIGRRYIPLKLTSDDVDLLERQNKEAEGLRNAVREFVREFQAIRWGWDGDCGATSLVELLENEALVANAKDDA